MSQQQQQQKIAVSSANKGHIIDTIIPFLFATDTTNIRFSNDSLFYPHTHNTLKVDGGWPQIAASTLIYGAAEEHGGWLYGMGSAPRHITRYGIRLPVCLLPPCRPRMLLVGMIMWKKGRPTTTEDHEPRTPRDRYQFILDVGIRGTGPLSWIFTSLLLRYQQFPDIMNIFNVLISSSFGNVHSIFSFFTPPLSTCTFSTYS